VARASWRRWTTVSILLLVAVYAGLSLVLQAPSVARVMDSPDTCASCHVMQAAWQSHGTSAHRSLTCADCHVDHRTTLAVWSKAIQGAKHLAMQALGQVPHPIVATESTRELVQQNCLRCHGDLMGWMLPQATARSCLDCHRHTPHGERRG